jgi:hypothetical protein
MIPSLVTVELARQRQAELLRDAGPLVDARHHAAPIAVAAALRATAHAVTEAAGSLRFAFRRRSAPQACATC